MPQTDTKAAAAGTAKLLVVFLAFCWGLNWIAAAVALREIPVWSLRFVGTALGAVVLFAAAALTGHRLAIPRGKRRHVIVAGSFNVAAFNVMAAFAQLNGATSRAIIITYSMPIWVAVFNRLLLGERLDARRGIALALCAGGLVMLIAPQLGHGVPIAVFFALGCALSWAFPTVYLNWVKADLPPLANAAWQLVVGTVLITIGMLVFDGYPHVWPIHVESMLAIVYIGVFGVGLAHLLWWSIVGRLSALTASIGVLLVPVVGVIASTVLLHERPSIPDIIGFVLIFAAAACVLLQPNVKPTEMSE